MRFECRQRLTEWNAGGVSSLVYQPCAIDAQDKPMSYVLWMSLTLVFHERFQMGLMA